MNWTEPCAGLGGESPEDWLARRYASQDTHALHQQLLSAGFRLSFRAVQRKAGNMGLKKTHIAPEYEPEPAPQGLDWREILDAAQVFQRRMRPVAPYTHRPVVIDTSRPICVMHSADWHLGSGATDYTAWQHDMEYVIETDGLYIAIYGDEINNVVTFKSLAAVIEQVIPVPLQRELLAGIVRELLARGKLLYTTWSNHVDEFDERIAGVALVEQIRAAQGVPHLNGMDVVRLQVGAQEYTVLATHKARFRSFLNALHGAKRLYQLVYPADVVVVAHDHTPGYESYNHYELAREMGQSFGGQSWLIACSTYKVLGDGWASRYFPKSPLQRITSVFWPNAHHVETFADVQSAVERARTAAAQ